MSTAQITSAVKSATKPRERTRFFPRTFIINLKDRNDRREEMTRELEKAGLPLEENHVEFFDAVRPTSAKGFPSIGTHGCFMSHLNVLRKAHALGLDEVMVLEDDVEFSNRFLLERVDVAATMRGTNWDMMFLGHTVEFDEPPRLSVMEFRGEIRCAHAYAIRKKAIFRLIDYLEGCLRRAPGDPIGGPMAIPGAFNMFRKINRDITCGLINPSLAWQRRSAGDIAPQKWFDSHPATRTLADLARKWF